MKATLRNVVCLLLCFSVSLASATFAASNIQYADQFTGGDFGAKVNAAIKALPTVGGTVDARGLYGTHTMSTTVNLGSQSEPITLLLPLGIIKRTHNAQFLLYNSSRLIGAGPNRYSGTLIEGNDNVDGAIAQGPAPSINIVSVEVAQLAVYDTSGSNARSADIALPSLLSSSLHDLSLTYAHRGLVIGGTGTCACYNRLDGIYTGFIGDIAVDLEQTANQNQTFGGTFEGATGLYVAASAGVNEFFGPDFEHDGIGVELGGAGNSLYGPYFEADRIAIKLDRGSTANAFYGSGADIERGAIRDDSGNTSNAPMLTGGGQYGGYSPNTLAVRSGFLFGPDLAGTVKPSASVANFYNDSMMLVPHPGSLYGLDLDYVPGTTYINNQYGLFGHGPLYAGLVSSTAGAALTGMIIRAAIPSPQPPTLTYTGAAGKTSYSYAVVCRDATGGPTTPSAFKTIYNCAARLDVNDYVTIVPVQQDGCAMWDVLKTDTSHALVTMARIPPVYPVKDAGQRPRAYSMSKRNVTADQVLPSGAQIRCANGGAMTLNNGVLACP